MRRARKPAPERGAILALDSSGAACSVAVLRGDAVAGHRQAAMARGHAEALMVMVVEAMQAAGIGFAALERVAVTVGPGSFTGLRIGLATARGIGLAASRPVVGVTTFAAVAEGLAEAERAGCHLLVVIDSKRTELFAQRFDPELRESGPPLVLAPALLAAAPLPARLLVAGDGARLLRTYLAASGRDVVFAERCGPPDAVAVARLAARPGATLLPARPLYLHAPEAGLPAAAS